MHTQRSGFVSAGSIRAWQNVVLVACLIGWVAILVGIGVYVIVGVNPLPPDIVVAVMSAHSTFTVTACGSVFLARLTDRLVEEIRRSGGRPPMAAMPIPQDNVLAFELGRKAGGVDRSEVRI